MQFQNSIFLCKYFHLYHLRTGNKQGVKFASQLLSSSVAKAIDHCREIGIKGFEGSEATSEFIQNFDKIFDLQNSSSKFGMELKAPFHHTQDPLIKQLCEYIKSLKDTSGKKILEGPKKTGFLGKLYTMLDYGGGSSLL